MSRPGTWFAHLFPRPVFPGDPQKTRVAAVSSDVIAVFLIGYCIYGLVSLGFHFYRNAGNVVIGWCIWAVVLLLRTQMRRGWVAGISFSIAALIAAGAVTTTWRLGTIGVSHTAWALVAIVYCVMTVGPRAGAILLVGALAGLAVVAAHEREGMRLLDVPPPFSQWAMLLAQALIVYAIGLLVRRHMIEALVQANIEHQALEAEREERRRLLESANRTLEMRVSQRTAELKQANDDLQRASQHLIQSEKLAALGGLVAGVAHELNTPIGNARLAATGMAARMEALSAQVESGRMSKTAMQEFLSTGIHSMQLIERSTERSSELVESFKQVAVDQTGMQRRSFDLRKTVEQTVMMFGPMLRRTTHSLSVEIDEGIALDGYPGAIEQIVNNFINNALLHAFTGVDGGRMRVYGAIEGEQVVLEFTDNGVGMSIDVQSRIFEPFYTTKFGQGGSGLGLYTVYNLVTSVFGGSIAVRSMPGEGTTFTIRFKRQAPEQANANINAA